ncbi:MAG: (2Fe-2S)-binding protein [Gammaproteobacteria bacterium]
MYICICNAISDRQIKIAILEGRSSVRELHAHFGFESCCGKCNRCMRILLDEHRESNNNPGGDLSCKATRQSFSCSISP